MDRTDSLLGTIVVLLALLLLEVSGGDSPTVLVALLVLAAVPLYVIGAFFAAVLEEIFPNRKPNRNSDAATDVSPSGRNRS